MNFNIYLLLLQYPVQKHKEKLKEIIVCCLFEQSKHGYSQA